MTVQGAFDVSQWKSVCVSCHSIPIPMHSSQFKQQLTFSWFTLVFFNLTLAHNILNMTAFETSLYTSILKNSFLRAYKPGITMNSKQQWVLFCIHYPHDAYENACGEGRQKKKRSRFSSSPLTAPTGRKRNPGGCQFWAVSSWENHSEWKSWESRCRGL